LLFDLVIIACGQRKIWAANPRLGPVEARKAYVGGYFLQNRAFAQRRGKRWLILSAKYGLLDPNTKIEDYDVTFKRAGGNPIQPERVREQVLTGQPIRIHDGWKVAVLGGREYQAVARHALSELSIVLKCASRAYLAERGVWSLPAGLP